MQRLFDYLKNFLDRKGTSFLQEYPTVYLTNEVSDATGKLVASFGRSSRPHEGIVYWAGIPTPRAWVITTALAPEAETTSGSYQTSVRANAFVVKKVNELKIQILAQVHGHPTDWVDHSDGDNTGAFMPYDGFYSVILPWYGQSGMLPLEKCGIHISMNGRFVRLQDEEIKQRFVVVPSSVDLRRTLKPLWKKN